MNGVESSPLLYIAMLGTMGMTAAALLKAWPAILTTTTAPAAEYVSIAGLRGLLAASVFVHHAQVSRTFFEDGVWAEPKSSFYIFAGTGCVGVFFMITGFLFWGKAIEGKVGFMPLLKGRIRRILPLYLLSFCLIGLICAYDSHFSMTTSWADLSVSILRWLSGGLLGRPDINGVGTLTINCGVTWTLQYEWIFYLVLPLIASFSPPRRFWLLMAGFLIVLLGLKKAGFGAAYQTLVVAVPFCGGMLSAYAVRVWTTAKLSKPWVSVFVTASFFLAAMFYVPGYFTLVAIGLFPAFAAIALGNDAFGLLRWRWVRFLGEISFSLYLLHGITLMAVLRALDRVVPIRDVNYLNFVLISMGLSVLVVLVSTTTYLLVERRFMRTNVARAGHPAVQAA